LLKEKYPSQPECDASPVSAEEGEQNFFFGAEYLGEYEWGMSQTHVFE